MLNKRFFVSLILFASILSGFCIDCHYPIPIIQSQVANAEHPNASCKVALSTIFKNEGGFQKMRSDSGNWTGGKVGVGKLVGTKYGICAASYPKVDIPNLTLDQATKYYERDFWNPLRLGELKSQGLATTILDTAVNCGTGTAGILMDRTANIIRGLGENAPETPSVSSNDIKWLNDYTYVRNNRVMYYLLFQAFRSERYAAIAKKDPNKKQYLDDWLIRTWR